MKRISSADNPIFRTTMKLLEKKERDRTGIYLSEGPNLLEEAFKNNVMPETIFISDALSQRETDMLVEMTVRQGYKGRIIVLDGDLFRRLSGTETPQGILAVIKKTCITNEQFFAASNNGMGNILVLDRVQDPGNLGTMIRTADAAGWQGVMIVKGSADIYSPKVVRAAAGSIFRIPILYVVDGAEAIDLLKMHGKHILVALPRSQTFYYEADMRENIALVIGNEGSGVSSVFTAEGIDSVTLPMAGSSESLNAAVAAGILMYESFRQTKEKRNKGDKVAWGKQI